MSTEVEQIKERLDIVTVVGGYVALQKAGANFKAKCPFHQEKTPSFFVSPQRNSYYCFGCGAKGDIFTFIQEIEGLDFRGALEFLAPKAGVELKKTSPKVREETDRALQALNEAVDFFRDALKKEKAARSYLAKRSLTQESIDKFLLGFAPHGWRNLKEHLNGLGYTDDELRRAGLIKKNDKGEDYDVFRERIIFPLQEASGRVVGFSGRSLDEENNPPKYLNSPDSVIFNKGQLLYGLDKAKNEIRTKNFSILVEGQMDLLMSHQAGITNTVAASGTAITPAHLERLKKISPRILISLDADGAGLKAALRTATLALERGMEVKIARLSDKNLGKDPAEILERNAEEYKNCLRLALPFVEFVTEMILKENKDQRSRAKRIEKEIVPLLALIESAVERSQTIQMVSSKTKIPEGALHEDTMRFIRSRGKQTFATQESVAPYKEHLNQIERHAAGLIFALQEKAAFPLEVEKELSFLGDVEKGAIIEHYKPEKETLVFEVENYYGEEDPERSRHKLKELIKNFKDDIFKRRLAQLSDTLSLAEEKKDRQEADRILKLIQDTSAEREANLKE